MVSEALSSISSFEKDIRSSLVKCPASLTGAQGFVSTKSFISLQLSEWSLKKLLENTDMFNFKSTNLLSMMTLSVEHFHSTTHTKQVLMTQLQYAREFMRSVKESLKRSFPWSAYYFTSRKGSWYPAHESSMDFKELSRLLPVKNDRAQISKSHEEKLRVWANSYTRAVRQRTVRQETTMAKSGTLPHYLYSTKISEVADTTKSFSASNKNQDDPSATKSQNDPSANISQNISDSNESPDENENQEEEDSYDPESGGSDTENGDAEDAGDIGGLDTASLFMVGRSSRFGRAIKINSKFIC